MSWLCARNINCRRQKSQKSSRVYLVLVRLLRLARLARTVTHHPPFPISHRTGVLPSFSFKCLIKPIPFFYDTVLQLTHFISLHFTPRTVFNGIRLIVAVSDGSSATHSASATLPPHPFPYTLSE